MKCKDMILGRLGKESCNNEKAGRVRRMTHPPYSIVRYICFSDYFTSTLLTLTLPLLITFFTMLIPRTGAARRMPSIV